MNSVSYRAALVEVCPDAAYLNCQCKEPRLMFAFNLALCGNRRHLFLNIHEVDSNIRQPRSYFTFIRFRRPWSLPSFLADRAEKTPSLPHTSQFQLDLRSADRAILLAKNLPNFSQQILFFSDIKLQ
jgi:hypothetical protein